MVTLKDVAKIANVDVSTVSRAINNTSYVHPETKKIIFEAIEEVGYTPKLVKHALKKGKRKTIAVVVPNINLTIFADIIESIKYIAKEKGYAIITCETQNDPEQEEALLNRLRVGLVDGIIIAGTGENKRLIKDLLVSNIEIVQIIRNDIKTISSVTANFYSSSYNAVNHLYNQGYRNIGLINGPSYLRPYSERYLGYRDAVREKKLPEINCDDINLEDDLVKAGYKATKKMLDMVPDLDSLIVSLDLIGIGASQAASWSGSMSEDIKIISLTGQSFVNMLNPNISNVSVPAYEIGKNSVNLLIEAIEASRKSPVPLRDIILDMNLDIE